MRAGGSFVAMMAAGKRAGVVRFCPIVAVQVSSPSGAASARLRILPPTSGARPRHGGQTQTCLSSSRRRDLPPPSPQPPLLGAANIE